MSKGYLLSQTKGVTRIFSDYIKTKDKPTFDNIGNTTIIPTAVITSIKKLVTLIDKLEDNPNKNISAKKKKKTLTI